MPDKKIPGAVYIIIGAGMMLMSFFDISKLSFFVFVGAIFVVIGFFKILIKVKKEIPQHATHPAEHAAHHAVQEHPSHPAHAATHPAHPAHLQAQHPAHAQHHTQSIHCSNCNVKLHPMFKFCPNCGQQLK